MCKPIHLVALAVLLTAGTSWCMAQRPVRQGQPLDVPAACGDSTVRQHTTPATDSSDKVDYHISLFSGVYGGGGETHAYTGAAPSLSYRVNDRLTLKAGFAFSSDINANSYRLSPRDERSLAPRRSNSTGAVAMDVAAEYKMNDNLWMAARLFYLGGSYDPVWNGSSRPYQLNAYGGSVALHYRTKNDNSLSLYLNFVHDDTGALTPWMLYSPFHTIGPSGWLEY